MGCYKLKFSLAKAYNLLRCLITSDDQPENEADILFVHNDVDKSVTLRGKAYSPIFGEINKFFIRMQISTTFFAHPWSLNKGQSSYHNCWTLNKSFFLLNIIERLFPFQLTDGLRVSFFEKLLKKQNIKLVFTIGCDRALASACRNRKVRLVEVLHGLGYSSDDWSYGNRPQQHLPTDILTFDSVSKRTFSKLSDGNFNVWFVEQPFLKLFYSELYRKSLPREWQYLKKPTHSKKPIIYFLQWGYGGEIDHLSGILENSLYPANLLNLISDTSDEIQWLLRLHPVLMRKNIYRKHIEHLSSLSKKFNNVELVECSQKPIGAVLQHCEGAMSMSSMASYDAALMGVRSLHFCPSIKKGGLWEDLFEDLVEHGFTTKMHFDHQIVKSWLKKIERTDAASYLKKGHTDIDFLMSKFLEKHP